MKRLLSLILILSMLLLCGCGSNGAAETSAPTETTAAPTTENPTEAPTEAPTEVPTEAPTEAPTEPPVVPTNPLTGETLDAPMDSRIFAVVINNVPGGLPHAGVAKADIYFEMYVNDYSTRGLALYYDVTEAENIGSVRSLRYNFTDICQAYDAIVVHASGSKVVRQDLATTDVPNVSVESEIADYYYRDSGRYARNYAYENTLFVKGPALKAYAESKGIRVTEDPDKDYGLTFAEDGTPADGENATHISISLIFSGVNKKTIMDYDEATGRYMMSQYNNPSVDEYTGEAEGFTNVIVMYCNVQNQDIYHVADLLDSGEGYFACGGKIIPILWSRTADNEPFAFTLTDGTPLELGVGSSYIAIAPMASVVEYE